MSRSSGSLGRDNGDAGAEGQPPLRAFPKPFDEPFNEAFEEVFDEPFEKLPSGCSRAFQPGFCTGFQGR
jgi:hypothetical protein